MLLRFYLSFTGTGRELYSLLCDFLIGNSRSYIVNILSKEIIIQEIWDGLRKSKKEGWAAQSLRLWREYNVPFGRRGPRVTLAVQQHTFIGKADESSDSLFF